MVYGLLGAWRPVASAGTEDAGAEAAEAEDAGAEGVEPQLVIPRIMTPAITSAKILFIVFILSKIQIISNRTKSAYSIE